MADVSKDIKLTQNADGQFDISVKNGDLEASNSFETMLLVSLLTDARAEPSQVLAPEKRRGWMGNLQSPVAGRQLGGLLWLVEQRRLTQSTLNDAVDYARKSVRWIVEDKLASNVIVTGKIVPKFGITLTIKIVALEGQITAYYFNLWELLSNDAWLAEGASTIEVVPPPSPYSHTWVLQTTPSPVITSWFGVEWSPLLGLFCMTGANNTGTDTVLTSIDGVNWTLSASADNFRHWRDIAWSPWLSLFAAISNNSFGDGAMTSPDGINWTLRTIPVTNDWRNIAWSEDLKLFCAVAVSGIGNRVMTSPDGITWTIGVSAANNSWNDLIWVSELSLFVAVSSTGTSNQFMTSPDGINWTLRNPPAGFWFGVAWSPQLPLLCSVGANAVATSPDGVNWTSQTPASSDNWRSVTWSPFLNLFIAVASSGAGNRVMTSPDGITWTIRVSAADNYWERVVWSPALKMFVAISSDGIPNQVMTSQA